MSEIVRDVWEGFVVLDAQCRIVCWPNSTPKLYNAPHQAEKSLEPGQVLAPISFRPSAFTVSPPSGAFARRLATQPESPNAAPVRTPTPAPRTQVVEIGDTSRRRIASGMLRTRLLNVLREAGGPLFIREIAERAAVDLNGTTVALNKLRTLGMVRAEQRANPSPGGRTQLLAYSIVRNVA